MVRATGTASGKEGGSPGFLKCCAGLLSAMAFGLDSEFVSSKKMEKPYREKENLNCDPMLQ